MNNNDMFDMIMFIAMIAVVTFQFVLNLFAYSKQKEIERFVGPHDVPEAFTDRSEVTFWQTISSGMLLLVGVDALLNLHVEVHVIRILFYVALAIKTVPSARWLWRYYRGKFDDTRTDRTSD